VRVRDLHQAGAHDQQHCCVRADVRNLQLLHGRLHYRLLCVAKTWVQKTNVKFAVINNFMFVMIMNATSDDDEAAVFVKDVHEDNDDLKTGPAFLRKKDAPAPLLFQPQLYTCAR